MIRLMMDCFKMMSFHLLMKWNVSKTLEREELHCVAEVIHLPKYTCACMCSHTYKNLHLYPSFQ